MTRLIDDLPNPNGVILSPDEKTLYVIPTGQADMMSYPVDAPGKIGKGKVFCTPAQPNGEEQRRRRPDGGRPRATSTSPRASACRCSTPPASTLGLIRVPEGPANVTFGGADFKTLYVTARTSLYTFPMEVAGHQFARGK